MVEFGNVPDLLFSQKTLISLNKIKAFKNQESKKRDIAIPQSSKKVAGTRL